MNSTADMDCNMLVFQSAVHDQGCAVLHLLGRLTVHLGTLLLCSKPDIGQKLADRANKTPSALL